jgi:hypothetical protein
MARKIISDLSLAHPVLQRKVKAVLGDVNKKLPIGWKLSVFETYRSPEVQAELVRSGASKTYHSKHANHPALAVDVVFQKLTLHGWQWNWTGPTLKDKRNGWALVDASKLAHNLRNIDWDHPHCELKPEDW